MAILRDDIKLLASERMIDTDDGGGRITGNEIVTGQHNSMFPDISDLDRAYGVVDMRKVFLGVETDNTDTYYGAHVTVLTPPADPNVSVTLFSTNDHNDERANARDRIERYLARGPKWQGYLYETQLEGQRALLVFQRESIRLPEVGEVLTLVADEGQQTEVEQYVRVKRVTSEIRTFLVQNYSQEFTRRVLTIEITDPLRHTFYGITPTPYDNVTSPTNLRETTVADAAKYYATSPLVEAAAFGAMQVKAESIYTQIVPSARSETPAVDLTAAGELAALVKSGTNPVSFSTVALVAPAKTLFLGTGAKHGSVSVTIGAAVITDVGGELTVGGTIIGSIDHARGLLEFNSQCPNYGTASKTVSFEPATAPIRVADTSSIQVKANTRGYAYTITLRPIPAPGSLQISYMAQGKWYDLRDNGKGECTGADASYGSGQLSYTTGSLVLTLGALPDVDSEIMFAWSTQLNYFNRSSLAPDPVHITLQAANGGLAPNTVMVSWNDGAEKAVTDNGAGALTGDGVGTVNYATGAVELLPNSLPLGGSDFTLDYDFGPPLQQQFDMPVRNQDGTITLALANGDLTPNAVRLRFNAFYEDVADDVLEIQTTDPIIQLQDDGAGLLFDTEGNQKGTVDYVNGTLTFTPDGTGAVPKTRYEWVTIGSYTNSQGQTVLRRRWALMEIYYVTAAYLFPIDESGWVIVQYRTGTGGTSVSEPTAINQLVMDITPRYGEIISEGSVRFTHGGRTIIDRLGYLYANVDPATGAGLQVGTVDYANGTVTLTDWTPGQANTVVLQSLLTSVGGQAVDEVTFRTPGAPLRPGSLYISANTSDGTLIDTTANNDGTINTSNMQGEVNYQTGIVRVRFGQTVVAAGNEAEPWFDAGEVDGDGNIWRPLNVFADTIRFNCVVYSYLPLDADLIGLDPVRLPSDGRVVVFRPGDIAVIHSTEKSAFPNGVTAGQTLDVGRTRLARCYLEDSDGALIPETEYSVDLDAGIITLATPLNIGGFTQPLIAVHRVEDMSLVTDAEISGRLTLARPLSHNYDPGSTQVSSALIISDVWSRVKNVFDQATWTSVFSDTRIGSETAAQFNATDYPLIVTNRGAIEQRWAVVFTSANNFKVIGEHVGQIATGDTSTECAPLNPNTGVPYFRLNPLGWGSGWATNNVLRFNTQGANYPVWVIRTILQSVAALDEDQFELHLRGNVNV